LRLGYFSPFFGLEGATSKKDQIFIENSPIWIFYPSNKTGALFSINGDNWSFSNGITIGNKKLENKKFYTASSTIFSRSTYSLIYNDVNLFHFGGSVYFTNYPNKFGAVSYRWRPENKFFDPIINTSDINVTRDSKAIALDLAWQKGPCSLQGEYVFNHLDRSAPYSSISMDGFYLQTAFVLTGEKRIYNRKSGYFGGIKPKNPYDFSNGTGTGAWETAFRYSNVNLNSRSIQWGKMSSYNFAVNWYPTTSIRVMNNFIYSNSGKSIFMENNKEKSYVLRLQFIF
jgi:phosphate-selective porin OprO/OprP